MKITAIAALAATAAVAPIASAANINVTIENTIAPGGASFSPFWIAAHDGSWDNFNAGETASAGIEDVAELANTGAITSAFAGSAAGAAGGFDATLASDDGFPPFTPGETTSVTYDIGDASVNRYFSFAAMVVPSNDLFVANSDPMAYELFDAAGNFNGPVTIEIYGSNVYDAGTEVNDASVGVAFIPGIDAMGGTEEGGVVAGFFTQDGASDYLDSFLGLETAAGYTFSETFGSDDLIARITIVPAPGGVSLGALGLVMGVRRRR